MLEAFIIFNFSLLAFTRFHSAYLSLSVSKDIINNLIKTTGGAENAG